MLPGGPPDDFPVYPPSSANHWVAFSIVGTPRGAFFPKRRMRIALSSKGLNSLDAGSLGSVLARCFILSIRVATVAKIVAHTVAAETERSCILSALHAPLFQVR